MAVALAACSAGTEPGDDPTSPAAMPEATSSPTPDAAPASPTTDDAGADATSLTDGSTPVDIGTYAGTWVVTTVEGAVTTIDDPSASEVPSTWVIEPAGTGGASHVRSSATTDERDMCLSLPGPDTVTLAFCDPADATQLFDVASLDQPEQVNISHAEGYLASDPDGGLSVVPDPGSPASVFTLTARTAAEG